MSSTQFPRETAPRCGRSSRRVQWDAFSAWLARFALAGTLLATASGCAGPAAPVIQTQPAAQAAAPTVAAPEAAALVELPPLIAAAPVSAIVRQIDLHTDLPARPRTSIESHTVESGDSLFSIALEYNLKPETLLWANYDTLKDNPDMLSLGMTLRVPPVDGILYNWKPGDTVDGIASQFNADPMDLLAWPGNHLDITQPEVDPDALVMIPGGSREFVQWFVPTIPRGRAGVNPTIYGPGACETGEGGLIGGGGFIWPAPTANQISGNDYWSGHLGIDIAAGTGTPIYASDSGVVVYSGSIGGGYGNMVMIDHGNGWQTLYAHLSKTAIRCGASVAQGNVIGYAGSTGNSTGPHLHFEVRYLGGFVNPWSVVQ